MAYKQPYKQVNKSDDGASVAFLAAIPAIIAKASAVAAKVATAVKAAKAGAVVAKGAKAAKLTAKAAKAGTKASKATKLTSKAAKLTTKAGKKTQQMAKWGDRAQKASNFSNKVQSGTTKIQQGIGKAKSTVKNNLGKFGDKVGDSAGKIQDKIGKVKETVDGKVEKFKDGYDNVAGKIADKTGFDKQNIKDFGADKAREGLEKGKEGVMNKLSQSGEDADLSPATRDLPSGISPSNESSYENPGASMFNYRKPPNKVSRYDNVNSTYGASTGNVTNANGGVTSLKKSEDDSEQQSLKSGNLFQNAFGDTDLGNFQAPITVKGITFDAADALKLGIMGYKAADKGIKDRKAITADEGFKESKKNLKSYKEGNLKKPDKFSDFADKKDNIKARRENIKSIKKKIKTKK